MENCKAPGVWGIICKDLEGCRLYFEIITNKNTGIVLTENEVNRLGDGCPNLGECLRLRDSIEADQS